MPWRWVMVAGNLWAVRKIASWEYSAPRLPRSARNNCFLGTESFTSRLSAHKRRESGRDKLSSSGELFTGFSLPTKGAFHSSPRRFQFMTHFPSRYGAAAERFSKRVFFPPQLRRETNEERTIISGAMFTPEERHRELMASMIGAVSSSEENLVVYTLLRPIQTSSLKCRNGVNSHK